MEQENEFARVLAELTSSKSYQSTLNLLRSPQYRNRVKLRCSDAIQACFIHLTDENYESNLDLYCCCEEFLKYVASTGPPDEILLDLLEVLETSRSDNVFTSVLKALQICLLRQQHRVNGLEWGLSSIVNFVAQLEVPEALERGYDEKAEKLLEQVVQVNRVLMTYMTINMFLEPLIKEALNGGQDGEVIFKKRSRTRRNILMCFMLQLLGRPLALLDLSNCPDSAANTNSLFCARTLSGAICNLLNDPLWLLHYSESKVRFQRKWRKQPEKRGDSRNACQDVFLLEEKLPLLSLGILYYLLLAEDLLPDTTPKVYNPLYIFEMNLYLANCLLRADESAIQYKGIRLGAKVVNNLATNNVGRDTLSLTIHQDFCAALSHVVIFSSVERNRKLGLELLSEYVAHFDEPGQFHLIQNLVRSTKHSGLKGYSIGLYKNMIAKSLEADELPAHFNSAEFKTFLLRTICSLPDKVETDLIENSEQVLAALNIIRYLAIRDKENRSRFWDFLDELERSYLKPLRTAIDLSRAHFKKEREQVSVSKSETMEIPRELKISVGNGDHLPDITKQHKLKMLDGALLTFDLIESLLCRVDECIVTRRENKAYVKQ